MHGITHLYINWNEDIEKCYQNIFLENMRLRGRKLSFNNAWKLTYYTPILCFHPFHCLYVSLSMFFCCTFSSILIPSFHHYLSPMICFPFYLLFYLLLPFSLLSTSLLFLSFFFLPFSCLNPSIIYFLLTSHLSLLPPSFIIPSLYWCSCRNETWLWLICWQSLRGPLVVVPLHRGHMWLIEPGENFVRLAIMTGSLAW